MELESKHSEHGDDIDVGGHKLKLSSIGIELHIESPLPQNGSNV